MAGMNILVADKLDAKALGVLEASGFNMVQAKSLSARNLPVDAIACEILIVRSTLVTQALIAKLAALKLIIRAGAGVDTIDLAAAAERGILVSNCPGKNADAVAEMALALLLTVDRKIAEGTIALRQGRWTKGALGQGMGLKGRVLGIVGFGAVGRAMTRKAKGLEMDVVVWSRSLTPQAAGEAGVRHAATLIELARASDAVSVHVASTPETRNLLGTDFFTALKPDSLFVNTARGEVVDRAALLEAIRSRGLRVGLDVFAGEPKVAEAPFTDTELAALSACAPHLGASTDQAAEAVAEEVIRIAVVFRDTGLAPNAVSS